jgi:hypothetical protein
MFVNMPDMRSSGAPSGDRAFHAGHRVRVDDVYTVVRDQLLYRPASQIQCLKETI